MITQNIKHTSLDVVGTNVVLKFDLGTEEEARMMLRHFAEQMKEQGEIWLRLKPSTLIIADGVLSPKEG